MHRRALINPLGYGVSWVALQDDPQLLAHRRSLVTTAARELEQSRMARFDEASGNVYVTELGRVASHFYIKHKTIVEFNEHLKPTLGVEQVCIIVCAVVYVAVCAVDFSSACCWW